MNTKLLDCTLRDGGHVNKAMFGRANICQIIEGLTEAKMDFIELGFLRDGTFSPDQALYNDVSQIYELLPEKQGSGEYTVMIRPDWYDIRQLSVSDGRISTIRFAFYYKDYRLMEEYSRIAVSQGYRFICNPVNILGYPDEQLKELLSRINALHPEQLTMVDTYGSMTFSKLHHLYGMIEERLDKDIRIGLHLHENQSLSFGLAQEFLRIKDSGRAAVIDASLLGMGRIPGNLCIELIADYMNETFGRCYQMDKLYQLIGDQIQPIKEKIPWGYSPAYYITAKYGMHRSYAEWLLEKDDLRLTDIDHILQEIKEKKYRDEFNRSYIEDLYQAYKDGKE